MRTQKYLPFFQIYTQACAHSYKNLHCIISKWSDESTAFEDSIDQFLPYVPLGGLQGLEQT